MASNRKLPFGYRMEFGEVVIHPLEAVMVQRIFWQYADGASYKEVLDTLRNQDVPYDPGKLWNKNMVARILENRKYTGEPGWPAIISEELYARADEKRSSKAAPVKRTEAQKILHRLSGGSTTMEMEGNVLRMLNDLVASPERICAPSMPLAEQAETETLRQVLTDELDQQPINEEATKAAAMELASARFATIGNQEYETVRLQRLFTAHGAMEELDAAILCTTVSAVQIRKGKVILGLKTDK